MLVCFIKFACVEDTPIFIYIKKCVSRASKTLDRQIPLVVYFQESFIRDSSMNDCNHSSTVQIYKNTLTAFKGSREI